MRVDDYNFLVTAIATLFGMFSLVLTYIGYVKFKFVDKIVEEKLNKEMNKFIDEMQDELVSLQNANTKIQASYQYFDSDIDSAIKLLTEASEIAPHAYNLYNTLGYAYIKKSDNYTAKMMFRKAIELHPKSIQGYNDMANLCKSLNDEKSYKHYYKLAVKNVENAQDNWQDIA